MSDGTSSAKRILVVEDDAETAEILAETLRDRGHAVEIAGSGEEGLARARRERPDVILLDLGLPGIHGLSVAEAIRHDPQLADVWLVAITGASSEDEAARIGFDAYFLKPVNYELLLLHLSRDAPLRGGRERSGP